MVCENCDQRIIFPGKIIKTKSDLKHCEVCGDTVMNPLVSDRWDRYFLAICEAVASNSRCYSRQIGAVLVRDKSVVATGYNGPARGVPHCGPERMTKDVDLRYRVMGVLQPGMSIMEDCPRKLMGFKSGQGLEWCIAAHAERNCIANAARLGITVAGTTMYMNSIISCKDCANELINAGVNELVVLSLAHYDPMGKFIISNSKLHVREFDV